MDYKIGIDGNVFIKTHPTGVEVASRELIHHLLKLDRDNHYIIYTPKPLPSRWRDLPNVTNHVVVANRFWTQRALPVAIREDHLDIFWSPAYMLPPGLTGIKTIATIHDVAFMKFPLAYKVRDWALSFSTVLKAKVGATKILAVSQQTKQDLKKIFGIGERRIEVVYNAVSHYHLRPNLQDIHEKYHLPEQFLLTVGRVEPRKNSTKILESFCVIAQNHPQLHLVFAGPKNQLSVRLEAEAKAAGLEHRVHFIGFVAELDLPMLYRAAEIFLFPSLYEGFGLPILESFAAGTPVITTNFGAPAEVANHAALLVNPHDTNAIVRAVSHLVGDEELKTKLVQAGYERLKDFSWEASAAKLKSIIDTL
ncbi:MAG: glycosyltransferase family 1 protein [Patescibacteria group bacterium]|nr:glycosyltransferase family 1 protein [Patescibacteria group bacterium]